VKQAATGVAREKPKHSFWKMYRGCINKILSFVVITTQTSQLLSQSPKHISSHRASTQAPATELIGDLGQELRYATLIDNLKVHLDARRYLAHLRSVGWPWFVQ